MASVCSVSNIVSVSCGTKTLIVRLSDSELFTFVHSEVNEKNNITEVRDDSQPLSKVQSENEEIGLGLVCCDVSSSGNHLAFCTLSKNLCIVDMRDCKPSVIRVYHLVRGASKVRFTPVNNHVVVADKSGDVYLFMPEDDNSSGQLILGHLSLLLDVLITPDEQFIITCDRDEKIRVSSYPNGYNILAYCLGHSEFVSSLCLLPHNPKYLISTSGDGTIRFWDYKLGIELSVCNTSHYFNLGLKEVVGKEGESEELVAAVTDIATTSVNNVTSLICVTVAIDNFGACLVFKCTTEADSLHCSFTQNISLDNYYPWSISLSSNMLWLVLCSNDSVQVKTKALNLGMFKFGDDTPASVAKAVQILNNQKMTADQKKNIVNLLFKRKFENVHEYLKKKEIRLMVQEPPNKKVKG